MFQREASENVINLKKIKRWENSTFINVTLKQKVADQFEYNFQLFHCHIFAQLTIAFKDPIVTN